MATSGHTTGQPGLRGHSFSEDNLLKQFLVFEVKEHGRLAVKSFENANIAISWIWGQSKLVKFMVKDQFNNDKIIYNEAGDED